VIYSPNTKTAPLAHPLLNKFTAIPMASADKNIIFCCRRPFPIIKGDVSEISIKTDHLSDSSETKRYQHILGGHFLRFRKYF
jgi:hypothetical protein